MDRLKPWLLETLDRLIAPRAVLEKSNLPSRKEEGMARSRASSGSAPDSIEIRENGSASGWI